MVNNFPMKSRSMPARLVWPGQGQEGVPGAQEVGL